MTRIVDEKIANARFSEDDDIVAMVLSGYDTTGKITLHVMGIDDVRRCDLDDRELAQYRRIQSKVTRRLRLMKKRKEAYVVQDKGRNKWRIVGHGEQE